MSYGYDPFDSLVRGCQRAPSGGAYEQAMAEPLMDFCVKNNFPCKILTGTKEDTHGGTDLRVYGGLGLLTSNAGILRIDITQNFSGKTGPDGSFSGKDNMPVLWQATPGLTQRGQPLKFGIRTGNKTQGFDWPVVVIGTDMSREDANSTVDFIRRETARDAEKILYEAGEALSAYMYMTEPAYKKWLDEATDENMSDAERAAWLKKNPGCDDMMLPDTSRLMANYDGLRGFQTRTRSIQTVRGLNLAMNLAEKDLESHPSDSPEYERAAPFWRSVHAGLNMPGREIPDRNNVTADKWMRQLNTVQEALAKSDAVAARSVVQNFDRYNYPGN